MTTNIEQTGGGGVAYTCPKTGVTIRADWLAGEYGSPDGVDGRAVISLIKREDEDVWKVLGDDVRQGDMTPSSEWHGRDIVISLWQGNMTVIYNSDLAEILDALKPLCGELRTIENSHTIEWDGNNYVGRLDEDASLARDEIKFDGDLHAYEGGCTQIVATLQSYAAMTRDAETWLYESLHEMDDDQLRDPGLEDELLQEAKFDRIRLFGDIQDVINEVICLFQRKLPTGPRQSYHSFQVKLPAVGA